MTAAALAGALAGLGVAVPVGAIALLLISLTARTSFKVGALAALGVATADGIYALIAVLGGAALAGVIAPVSRPLRWVAAVVLLVIAVRMVVTAVRHYRDPASAREVGGLTTPLRAYASLLGITLLNPMTIVYFGALVLGRGDSAELGAAGSLVFVIAAFLASAAWQLTLAGGGALVGRILTGPRGRLGTALVSGAVIGVLAVGLVWS
ncbi:arginine exporter protein ArgO [Allocatelliglobosispora scoriae]|uniref:Arginine exporter protein ArgO n=1 Tax=Allocatelliglobosispora scoriae TaxID=643052 RepID=A0A841BQX9_9ACTN|nr:LysE family transporter [Allocatelliglobosispora scoriae]MBB5869220.1 arginine exporter protein ArgO [Allocatelliglobosispora scoriae]